MRLAERGKSRASDHGDEPWRGGVSPTKLLSRPHEGARPTASRLAPEGGAGRQKTESGTHLPNKRGSVRAIPAANHTMLNAHDLNLVFFV